MKLFFYISILVFVSVSADAQIEVELIETTALEADRVVGIDNMKSNFYIKDNTLYKSQNQNTSNYSNLQ